MVVGRESRGKTTLLRRLMERGQQTEDRSLFSRRHNSGHTQLTTVGISLRDWVYRRSSNVIADIRTITYRTWDFAGQVRKLLPWLQQSYHGFCCNILVTTAAPKGSRGSRCGQTSPVCVCVCAFLG